MAGFGLSACVFNLFTTWLINPDNISPSIREADGEAVYYYYTPDISDWVPIMIRCLFLAYTFLSVVGVLLLAELNEAEGVTHEYDLEKGLVTSDFYILFASAFFSSAYCLYIPASFKIFGSERIQDDHYLAVVGSVGSLCNGFSRLAWAYLFDWTTFKKTYSILLFIQLVVSCSMYYASCHAGVYMFAVAVSFLCEGGHFAIFPAIYAKKFGRK